MELRKLEWEKMAITKETMKFLLLSIWLILASNTYAQTLPHTFSANSAAKAEEVNENFQFLANQFKVNKKTIDCSTDNMTKSIEDGYNHLVINGTCTENLLITQFIKSFDGSYSSFGFTSNNKLWLTFFLGNTWQIRTYYSVKWNEK